MSIEDIVSFYDPHNVSTLFGAIDAEHSTPHTGVDYALPAGTPIPAIFPGQIVASSQDPYNSTGLGYYITEQVAPGYQITYGHLINPPAQQIGDNVDLGQTIGYVGSTGHSTGPHLHLAITNNGNYVDPLPIVNNFISQISNALGSPNLLSQVVATPGNVLNTLTGAPGAIAGAVTGLPGDISGAVTSAVNNALGGVNVIGQVFTDVYSALKWTFTAKHFWSVGFVAAGSVIILLGVVVFMHDDAAALAETVGKVAA